MWQASVLAGISLLLYLTLGLVSARYYFKFRTSLSERMTYAMSNVGYLGRFDGAKALFFLVLSISAFLDTPYFVGCLLKGGPEFCMWNGISYPILWFFHLFAINGYSFTIMIPAIMWYDIIHQKDGKLFGSNYPVDNMKRFFQLCFIVYVLNTTVDLIGCILHFRLGNPSAYQSSSPVDSICTITEMFLVFLITIGCFICGVKLQHHVMKARATTTKIFFHLNVTMLIIMTTYIVRALFILRLVHIMPKYYREAFPEYFPIWMLCTRWLPYIFCSFCLIALMRHTGEEIALKVQNKHALTTALRDSDTFATSSQSDHSSGSRLSQYIWSPLTSSTTRKNLRTTDYPVVKVYQPVDVEETRFSAPRMNTSAAVPAAAAAVSPPRHDSMLSYSYSMISNSWRQMISSNSRDRIFSNDSNPIFLDAFENPTAGNTGGDNSESSSSSSSDDESRGSDLLHNLSMHTRSSKSRYIIPTSQTSSSSGNNSYRFQRSHIPHTNHKQIQQNSSNENTINELIPNSFSTHTINTNIDTNSNSNANSNSEVNDEEYFDTLIHRQQIPVSSGSQGSDRGFLYVDEDEEQGCIDEDSFEVEHDHLALSY